MQGLPTGTVTFLFTDLEGSTRLWEEHPDDMRVALARHDEILRKAVEAHDGAIVKTTGDGLHAAFATADHALTAAIDAQLALVGEVWPLPEPLRVRMGIYTGAAEERDGDYYGPAVNRAARVAAAAHGEQILVSHATEELGRDSLPPRAALVDLGEHRLRDLARAGRVFQLVAPGLLVAKSMVLREPGSTRTRYAMLETLRQYARERLDERDEADTVRRRHAQHYVTVARQLEVGLHSPEEIAFRERFGDDLDNLRAVVAWGLDREDAADRDLALLVIAHLGLEANLDRTRGIGTWALRAISAVDDAEPWIRSAVLGAAAEDLRSRNEFDDAIRLADAGLRDGVRLPGPGPALVLIVRGLTRLMEGEGEAGLDEMLESMAMMRDEGMTYELGSVATVASSIAGFAGRMDDAEAVANEAFAIAEAMGSPTILTGALFARGNAIDARQPEEALRSYEECISICRDGASKAAFGPALGVVAFLWHRRGDDVTALDRAIESVEHTWSTGDLATVGTGLGAGAVIASDLEEYPAAVSLLAGAQLAGPRYNAVAEHDPRWRAVVLRQRLRDELGDSEFERLWNHAASRSTEQIVEQGLTELRRVRASLARSAT